MTTFGALLSRSFVVGCECQSRQVGSLQLTERAYAPRLSSERHAHEYACLDFVLSGTVREIYKGRSREATAGRMLYYAPGAEHSWSAGCRGARILHAIVPIGLLRHWELDESKHECELSEQRAPPLAYRLFYEFRIDDRSSGLSIESSCAELLCDALEPARSHCSRPSWLKRVETMLINDHSSNHTLAALAEAAGVHPGHFARTFRQIHGCPPGQYLRRARLTDASNRVMAGVEPLASIAYRSGFSDQAHFSREFKRHIGCSPGWFRRHTRTPLAPS